jgi:hypothetical protein
MKVIENTDVFPPRKHFVDVEPKFNEFTKNCRVLPAVYFDEPNVHFILKARYEPGEKSSFPNGGFEVYGPEGSTYNYELDQVVVHPYQFRMMKYFSKIENTVKDKVIKVVGDGKRGRPRKEPGDLKVKTVYIPTGGKRGRKSIDPVIKAAKKAELAAKKAKGSGKKGRPRKQIS